MLEYLNFLTFTALSGNYFVLIEAVRIFERAVNKKPDILDSTTVHRILGVCC